MTTEERKRCDNLACMCEVPIAQPACSPYCASPDARDVRTAGCTCGHDVCRTETERRLHGGAGRESLS